MQPNLISGKNHRITTVALVVLISIAPARLMAQAQGGAPEKSWLCVADAATGFAFDKATKTWGRATFKTEAMKYLIRRPTDAEKRTYRNPEWVAAQIGDTTKIGCAKDFSEDDLYCTRMSENFTFNRQTMRYQFVTQFGYVSPFENEGDDTPHIEIGRCTPL